MPIASNSFLAVPGGTFDAQQSGFGGSGSRGIGPDTDIIARTRATLDNSKNVLLNLSKVVGMPEEVRKILSTISKSALQSILSNKGLSDLSSSIMKAVRVNELEGDERKICETLSFFVSSLLGFVYQNSSISFSVVSHNGHRLLHSEAFDDGVKKVKVSGYGDNETKHIADLLKQINIGKIAGYTNVFIKEDFSETLYTTVSLPFLGTDGQPLTIRFGSTLDNLSKLRSVNGGQETITKLTPEDTRKRRSNILILNGNPIDTERPLAKYSTLEFKDFDWPLFFEIKGLLESTSIIPQEIKDQIYIVGILLVYCLRFSPSIYSMSIGEKLFFSRSYSKHFGLPPYRILELIKSGKFMRTVYPPDQQLEIERLLNSGKSYEATFKSYRFKLVDNIYVPSRIASTTYTTVLKEGIGTIRTAPASEFHVIGNYTPNPVHNIAELNLPIGDN